MPWNGSLLVPGLRSDPSRYQEIFVVSVETEGESRTDIWPSQLLLQIVPQPSAASQVHDWVMQRRIPVCTLMAAHRSAQGEQDVNRSSFRAFSHSLYEGQLVACAFWNSRTTETVPGPGVLIYPTPGTNAILTCAVFHSSSFPPFLGTPSVRQYPQPPRLPPQQPLQPPSPGAPYPPQYRERTTPPGGNGHHTPSGDAYGYTNPNGGHRPYPHNPPP